MPSELENIKPSVVIAHKSFGQLFSFPVFFFNVKSFCVLFVCVCFVWCAKAKHTVQPFFRTCLKHSIDEIVFIRIFWKMAILVSWVIYFCAFVRNLSVGMWIDFLNIAQQHHGWFIIALIELLLIFLFSFSFSFFKYKNRFLMKWMKKKKICGGY